MLSSWLEQRLHLQKFFTQPLLPKGLKVWLYFPGIAAVFFVFCQLITGIILAILMIAPESSAAFFQKLHTLFGFSLVFCCLTHAIFETILRADSNPKGLIQGIGWLLLIVILFELLIGLAMCPYFNTLRNNSLAILCAIPFLGTMLQGKYATIFLLRLHTTILPILFLCLLGLHLWLRSRLVPQDKEPVTEQ